MGTYNKEIVKENIDLEDVYNLLDFYSAEPKMFSSYIISKTICHNGIGEGSKKLYYYANTNLFKCYSGDCGTFDIFDLVCKVEGIEDLNKAIYFVVNFFNLQSYIEETDFSETYEDWKIFKKYEKINDLSINKNKVVLPEIPNLIEHYPSVRIPMWEKEHISKEIIDYMGIKYDPVNQSILIPHKDENGRLIGIRQRTLVQEQEIFGKYKPARVRGQLCNHPLAFSLYGFDIAKENIKRAEVAIILESEKSVMQAIGYLGLEGTIATAVCGSNLSKYQFQLLLDSGAKELVIGFDKDFQESGTEDFYHVVNKLEKIYQKYSAYVNISFLFDKENLLDYKNSPTDCGKDAFMYLWKNRIFLNG